MKKVTMFVVTLMVVAFAVTTANAGPKLDKAIDKTIDKAQAELEKGKEAAKEKFEATTIGQAYKAKQESDKEWDRFWENPFLRILQYLFGENVETNFFTFFIFIFLISFLRRFDFPKSTKWAVLAGFICFAIARGISLAAAPPEGESNPYLWFSASVIPFVLLVHLKWLKSLFSVSSGSDFLGILLGTKDPPAVQPVSGGGGHGAGAGVTNPPPVGGGTTPVPPTPPTPQAPVVTWTRNQNDHEALLKALTDNDI